MRQAPALSQSQRLGGRLERTRYGFIVDGPPARLWGRQAKREVADGDALEVSELAVLADYQRLQPLYSRRAYICKQPRALTWWRLGLGCLGCLSSHYVADLVDRQGQEQGVFR